MHGKIRIASRLSKKKNENVGKTSNSFNFYDPENEFVISKCRNNFQHIVCFCEIAFPRLSSETYKYIIRCIVLDCTEISLQKSKCLQCRLRTYSHYKSNHTVKFLIGISPTGLITYVSNAYGGRASDKQIFNQSKLLELMLPNDAIMVDKGFLIEKECPLYNVKLIRPPFLKKNKQFSNAEAEKTASIAAARVHVERTIQRLKIF